MHAANAVVAVNSSMVHFFPPRLQVVIGFKFVSDDCRLILNLAEPGGGGV